MRSQSRAHDEPDPATTSDRPGIEATGAQASRATISARLALGVFVLYLVVAFFVLLRIGDFHWFLGDEWDLLATRTAGDVNDWFRPHNEHWVTLPLFVYRALWTVFGLRSYVPYQVVAIATHLAVVVLVRVVMRRAGVGPWMATIAAAPLVLFGTGAQNMLWGFQIAFTGALAFGLAHVILADHDGPIDRRDLIGLGAGAAALMCSNVGVAMAVVCGLAVLVRRGWKVALFHTLPLAAMFSVWWLATRPEITTSQVGTASAGQLAAFVRRGAIETLVAIGQYPAVAVSLGVLLVVGLVLAWRPLDRGELRRLASMPLALLVGGAVFFLTAGIVRAVLGDQEAEGQRFLYTGAVLALPALAVAADAVARRWLPLAPVVAVLFLVGIPANVRAFDEYPPPAEVFELRREWTLHVPTTSLARDIPRSARPDPGVFGSPGLTIGWLLDARAQDKLPEPGSVRPATAAQARVRLGLIQTDGPAPSTNCEESSTPRAVALQPGDEVGMRTSVEVVPIDEQSRPQSAAVTFIARDGGLLTAYTDLRVRFGAVFPNRTFTLCR